MIAWARSLISWWTARVWASWAASMALWWWGIIASMNARSKGSAAFRSVSTSWAMFIVMTITPVPGMSWSIGICAMLGVSALPYQASRHAFIWSISLVWPCTIAWARSLISWCSARSCAMRAISTAPWWWGTIMSMKSWSNSACACMVPMVVGLRGVGTGGVWLASGARNAADRTSAPPTARAPSAHLLVCELINRCIMWCTLP